MSPKFSVVTISFNHAEFIEKTILSVLEQNYSNFEHIIIDGGSTDDTISILKKYPHLNWISEKDSGVSNALNKGFRKATGDIIGWLNSDDFYLPGAFDAVASAIANGPVVLGDSIESDRQGNPIQTVKNFPRSYYDLQKYWIPKAWLAQPSVFFTKAVLNEVAFSNDDLIDESFKYSMDFDLWLRLAEKYPFTNYIPKALSSFRIYGENLTGKAFASPQRELGRAFRASLARTSASERNHAFVIPVTEITEDLGNTLQSLFTQTLHGFDVIIADCTKSKEQSKIIKETIQSLEESTTLITFRLINTVGLPFFAAINKACQASTAQITTVLECGNILSPNFTTNAFNLFAHDPYGGCVHVGADSESGKILTQQQSLVVRFNSLLDFNSNFIPLSFRTAIFNEIRGFVDEQQFPWQDFIMKMSLKGWMCVVEENGSIENLISPHKHNKDEKSLEYQRALLFTNLHKQTENDIFYPIRSESAYAPTFSAEALNYAKQVIRN